MQMHLKLRRPFTGGALPTPGDGFFRHVNKVVKNNRAQLFAPKAPTTPSVSTIPTYPMQTAKEAIMELHSDMKELRNINPTLSINLDSIGQLEFYFTDRKEATFKVMPNKEGKLNFECPSAEGNSRSYAFDPTRAQWISEKDVDEETGKPVDGHSLHGILLRDLIPYVNGLPKFAFKRV
jgi:hypothetical protein